MVKILPPSGFRDFLPNDYLIRKHFLNIIENTCQSFGFLPIETPIMDNISILKGSEENEKLMYQVIKRGVPSASQEVDLGIRFDLTVPLARYYISNRGSISNTFKCYQIGKVYRAERAAKGRFREFVQCDMDIIGSSSILAEADLVNTMSVILDKLGFSELTFRINMRSALISIISSFGILEDMQSTVISSIDKMGKESTETICRELINKGVSESIANALLEFFNTLSLQDAKERIRIVQERTGSDLTAIVDLMGMLNIKSGKLVFDPSLARGMDYYTGLIFEVNLAGVPFSIAGGGRYDGLIEQVGGVKTPACGFSLGFERILTVLESEGKIPVIQSNTPKIVICPLKGALVSEVFSIYEELLQKGIQLELSPSPVNRNKTSKDLIIMVGRTIVEVLDIKQQQSKLLSSKELIENYISYLS